MKKNSIWDIIRSYTRLHTIVAGILLVVVLVLILGKAIFNWFAN